MGDLRTSNENNLLREGPTRRAPAPPAGLGNVKGKSSEESSPASSPSASQSPRKLHAAGSVAGQHEKIENEEKDKEHEKAGKKEKKGFNWRKGKKKDEDGSDEGEGKKHKKRDRCRSDIAAEDPYKNPYLEDPDKNSGTPSGGRGSSFYERPDESNNNINNKKTMDQVTERLDRLEKCVEKLGGLIDLHHEKQSVELSRFVMVITQEICGSSKKEKEESAKQAARIEALEKALQETKQNMMEALVLNAKKVELLAKKDKRIEELEYLLKQRGEGGITNSSNSIVTSRSSRLPASPKPLPALPNPGDKPEDLPPLENAPPIPILSIDIAHNNAAPNNPTPHHTTTQHNTLTAEERQPNSPIVIGRPSVRPSDTVAHNASDQLHGSRPLIVMDEEEGYSVVDDEQLGGKGYGTLRAKGAAAPKGSKALRTLGVTPSQEKLMNVLGLDMPPSLDPAGGSGVGGGNGNGNNNNYYVGSMVGGGGSNSSSVENDGEESAPKTPKTPKQVLNFLMKKKEGKEKLSYY